jgi:hypothetical protein
VGRGEAVEKEKEVHFFLNIYKQKLSKEGKCGRVEISIGGKRRIRGKGE